MGWGHDLIRKVFTEVVTEISPLWFVFLAWTLEFSIRLSKGWTWLRSWRQDLFYFKYAQALFNIKNLHCENTWVRNQVRNNFLIDLYKFWLTCFSQRSSPLVAIKMKASLLIHFLNTLHGDMWIKNKRKSLKSTVTINVFIKVLFSGGSGSCPRCYRTRDRVHPGQVSSNGDRQATILSHVHNPMYVFGLWEKTHTDTETCKHRKAPDWIQTLDLLAVRHHC